MYYLKCGGCLHMFLVTARWRPRVLYVYFAKSVGVFQSLVELIGTGEWVTSRTQWYFFGRSVRSCDACTLVGNENAAPSWKQIPWIWLQFYPELGTHLAMQTKVQHIVVNCSRQFKRLSAGCKWKINASDRPHNERLIVIEWTNCNIINVDCTGSRHPPPWGLLLHEKVCRGSVDMCICYTCQNMLSGWYSKSSTPNHKTVHCIIGNFDSAFIFRVMLAPYPPIFTVFSSFIMFKIWFTPPYPHVYIFIYIYIWNLAPERSTVLSFLWQWPFSSTPFVRGFLFERDLRNFHAKIQFLFEKSLDSF